MRTLRDLINNPVTNPYTIDVLAPDAAGGGDTGDQAGGAADASPA